MDLPWQEVEKAIDREIQWLQSAILPAQGIQRDDPAPGLCNQCIFRRIAVLIITGKVKAKQITSSVSLFGDSEMSIGKQHGKDWHGSMMRRAAHHFRTQGYGVTIEPNLNFGRADLGVFKPNENPLYVEIGTISLHKLLVNLESMENSDLLVVSDEGKAVEFSVLSIGYKLSDIDTAD